MFGRYEEEFEATADADELAKLVETVRDYLPNTELICFSDIAESIDVVPWDVLTACRRLVRIGVAREGKGRERGCFGRR